MYYINHDDMDRATHNAIGINGHKFSEYTFFFIPFSINTHVKGVDGHAVLAIINNLLHIITIYDPDNPNRDNIYDNEVEGIRRFHKKVGCGEKYDFAIAIKPQQKTEIDCGVFVMEYGKRKLLGEALKFDQSDIKNIRTRIKKELTTRKNIKQ